jgi:hypothetical protein
MNKALNTTRELAWALGRDIAAAVSFVIVAAWLWTVLG